MNDTPLFRPFDSRLPDPTQRAKARAKLRGLKAVTLGRVQVRLHTVVGQLGPAVDEARPHVGPRHLPVSVEGDRKHEGAAVHLWIQRYDALTEHLGEHRDHKPRQVVAGASAERLGEERSPTLHVVGTVREGVVDDGSLRVVSVDVERLIKVQRVRVVDGDERQVTQVGERGVVEAWGKRQLRRLVHHRGRKLRREGKFLQKTANRRVLIVACHG